MCQTVRTYYVPYHFVGPFYALFRFLAVVHKTKRKHSHRTITVGTLSLLTTSLWSHPHTLTVVTPSHPHCGNTLTPHTLTVGTPSHAHIHMFIYVYAPPHSFPPPLLPTSLCARLRWPFCVRPLPFHRERAAEFIPITLPLPPR